MTAPLPATATWPFEGLTPLKYGAILADCPWPYEMYSEKGYGKSPEAHYDTMSIDDIKALPVGQLAGGDCMLFMWSTWPHLNRAMEVLTAWGFTYKTGGAWLKLTKTGKQAFGPGYILRTSCEPFLVGTIGRPLIGSRSERNFIAELRREHSRKPEEMRAKIERLLPRAFCCELFAREAWPGHEVWGNQSQKFDVEQ